MKEIIVEFEKIGHNGVSIGRYNGKVVFAYGVLPGEKAKIKVTQEKKNLIKGEVVEILEKSKYRIQELEDHYLSCSPWQVFAYNYQVEIKRGLLREIFRNFAGIDIEINDFFASPDIFGYRTKIEYSFLEENNRYFFAFHKRENFREKVKLSEGCKLISEKANSVSLLVLEEINKRRIKDLKTLIIRKSRRYDDIYIALLTSNKNQNFSSSNQELTGFSFIYSKKESPASTFDEIIYEWGREYLREKILNLEIIYHYTSFFQNNIELFEKALRIMRENSNEFNKVVDLYAGVGVIGLSLKDYSKEIWSVEIDKTATQYAKVNAELNDIKNFKALTLASEKIPRDVLENRDLLILDPPRAGLHKKLIKLILETKPRNIFYLSCNPITQARDFGFLKEVYSIKKFYGFDFYPNTPHLESLLILEIFRL
jgi:23S rRNA (uracil1939-C5)-methyltransferase